ncbi:MAG TPA: hypothetical protein VFG96_01305 [Jiangellaceae bacterium]|nr:hypothetical protein [Jiangellaceae bacterium]
MPEMTPAQAMGRLARQHVLEPAPARSGGHCLPARGAPELAERIRSGWGVMLKPAAAGGLLVSGRTVSAT